MILFNSEHLVACIPYVLSAFLNIKVEVTIKWKTWNMDFNFVLIYISKCLIFTLPVLFKILNSLSSSWDCQNVKNLFTSANTCKTGIWALAFFDHDIFGVNKSHPCDHQLTYLAFSVCEVHGKVCSRTFPPQHESCWLTDETTQGISHKLTSVLVTQSRQFALQWEISAPWNWCF